MEGADPHPLRVDLQQLLDALAHLCGGLVGEGHRQDRMQRSALDLVEPGDAVHQHPGLARAGAGEHQLTAQRRGHGLALGIVEGVQEEREIVMHRGILLEMRRMRSSLARARWRRRRNGRRRAFRRRLCLRASPSSSLVGTGHDAELATCHYRSLHRGRFVESAAFRDVFDRTCEESPGPPAQRKPR